jgi:hypothetical protein
MDQAVNKLQQRGMDDKRYGGVLNAEEKKQKRDKKSELSSLFF